MAEEDLYSTIRTKPALARKNAGFLSSFYDNLLKPHVMLGTVLAAFAFLWNQIPTELFHRISMWDQSAILYVLLAIFTVLTGSRLIQSAYLASRDYQSLEASFKDVFIFVVLVFFVAGLPFKLFPLGEIRWLALLYAVLAFIGAANFIHLYSTRLSKRSPNIDYLIERRIQAVNALTFIWLSMAMFGAFALIYAGRSSSPWPMILIVLTYPVIIFNIMHSSQMSLRPKFLFANLEDSPDNAIKQLRKIAPRTTEVMSDENIRKELLAKDFEKFQRISLVRAGPHMAEQISERLLTDFSYVYDFVFQGIEKDVSKAVLLTLINSLGGFGTLGFVWFYAIKDESNQVIGFLKPEFRRNWDVYSLIEAVVTPLALVRITGFEGLLSIYRKQQEIRAVQPLVDHDEIHITYILITPEHRRRGFATATIELLVRALHERSNDILAARLVVLVRENNAAALKVFERAGFKKDGEVVASSTKFKDPIAGVAEAGRAMYLLKDLINTPKK
jgi:ribosomal protein S18 acetylase RimI-like enzyme